MEDKNKKCDPILISKFIDSELSREEKARVEVHLKECPSCQRVLEDLRGISRHVKNFVESCTNEIKDCPIEKDVIEAINKTPWWKKWKNSLVPKPAFKIAIPAGALVGALFVFLTILPGQAPNGPSAIVKSISGDASTIVILETPETHQTILWFNEGSERQAS